MTQAGIAATAAKSMDHQRDPLRSDARDNRERILAVARDALAASGDASLNSIAKKAGVGPGTLYRHFPSREALVLAVYREDVGALTDSAAELLAAHGPLQALRLWFDSLSSYAMTNRSLAAALQSVSGDGTLGRASETVSGAAALLISACRDDGSIRHDIATDDVLLLLGFLWRMEPGPDGVPRAARILEMIVSGLQAGAVRDPRNRRGGRPVRRSFRRRLSVFSLGTTRSI
jgi:AcrR family transcriptional regulator